MHIILPIPIIHFLLLYRLIAVTLGIQRRPPLACCICPMVINQGRVHVKLPMINPGAIHVCDNNMAIIFSHLLQVEFTHRIAWRRDSTQGGTCDDSTIENEELLGSGELVCRKECSGTVGSMKYFCNDFSVLDNWSTGERTYEYNFGVISNFEAS